MNPIETKTKALITILVLKVFDGASTFFFAYADPRLLELEVNLLYRLFPSMSLWTLFFLTTALSFAVVYFTYENYPAITEAFVLLLPFIAVSNTLLALSKLGYVSEWVGGLFQALYLLGFLGYLLRGEYINFKQSEGTKLQRVRGMMLSLERPTQVWCVETEEKTDKDVE